MKIKSKETTSNDYLLGKIYYNIYIKLGHGEKFLTQILTEKEHLKAHALMRKYIEYEFGIKEFSIE